ncbi:hypothetical protein B9G53_10160 [Pseudanabaena sp. SR411]|nr:hypothetical protein B9G53_10160 [Pseudanabaena sp. SR411]
MTIEPIYSYSQPSQDIRPKRELRRFAPQLSFGFWLCLNIDVYSYICHQIFIVLHKLWQRFVHLF